MDFRIDLDTFRGPLDLLLYLVRKHEVEIVDLPIATIAQQYLEYLEVLQELDVNAAGEFLDMASTLAEIKSRLVLPHGDEEFEALDDPREELVERLLEYKKYKDAASVLDEQGRQWQQRFPRLASDLPPRRTDLENQPIHEVELWDLVSALGRMMRDRQRVAPTSIVYDDTPIQVYMQRIHERLLAQRRAAFSELFAPGMHKSAMVGMFLAILELVRHHSVRTEQGDLHGEIWVLPGESFSADLNLQQVDNYERPPIVPDDLPVNLK
jgi:segregation and condensation protein A